MIHREIGGGTTYSSDILFIELRTDDSNFDKVFDICHTSKATQRWWESLFDMTVGIAGHFDFEPVEVEIGEHTIVGTASIVERELRGCCISMGQLSIYHPEFILLP